MYSIAFETKGGGFYSVQFIVIQITGKQVWVWMFVVVWLLACDVDRCHYMLPYIVRLDIGT